MVKKESSGTERKGVDGVMKDATIRNRPTFRTPPPVISKATASRNQMTNIDNNSIDEDEHDYNFSTPMTSSQHLRNKFQDLHSVWSSVKATTATTTGRSEKTKYMTPHEVADDNYKNSFSPIMTPNKQLCNKFEELDSLWTEQKLISEKKILPPEEKFVADENQESFVCGASMSTLSSNESSFFFEMHYYEENKRAAYMHAKRKEELFQNRTRHLEESMSAAAVLERRLGYDPRSDKTFSTPNSRRSLRSRPPNRYNSSHKGGNYTHDNRMKYTYDKMKAAASLERRLSYTPPMASIRRNKRISSSPLVTYRYKKKQHGNPVSSPLAQGNPHHPSHANKSSSPRNPTHDMKITSAFIERGRSLQAGGREKVNKDIEISEKQAAKGGEKRIDVNTQEIEKTMLSPTSKFQTEQANLPRFVNPTSNLDPLNEDLDPSNPPFVSMKKSLDTRIIQQRTRRYLQQHGQSNQKKFELLENNQFKDCSEAALLLQNGWRSHRSRILLSSLLIQSWWLKCDFESEVTFNRILLMKIGLQCLTMAIGRVDCWWISEVIRIKDNVASVKWGREVGVYYTECGTQQLRTCRISLKSSARLLTFMKKWSKSKLAISIVKATLEQALKRDEDNLVSTSALFLQRWMRMITAKSKYSRLQNALSKQQQQFDNHSPVKKGLQTEIVQHSKQIIDFTPAQVPCTSTVIILQAWIRRCREMTRYRKMLRGFILLQAQLRCTIQLNKIKTAIRSSIVIQTMWRQHESKSMYRTARNSTIMIQSAFRMIQCRHSMMRRKHCATAIQSMYRGQRDRRQYQVWTIAATTIQSSWRKCHMTKLYVKQKQKLRSAISIQSLFRRIRCRRTFKATLSSIITVQSLYRSRLARRDFESLQQSIVLVQRCFRGTQLRSRLQFCILLFPRPVTAYIGDKIHEIYCEVVYAGVVKFQSRFRMVSTRAHFLRMQTAARSIERFYIGWKREDALLQLESSTILLNRSVRGHLPRTAMSFALVHLNVSLHSALLLSFANNLVGQDKSDLDPITHALSDAKTHALRSTCIFLQCEFRGILARKKFLKQKNAAILIQRFWRHLKNT